MSEKLSILKMDDSEIVKEYHNCVDIYTNGLLLLEDVTKKIKINRVKLSLIEEEIKKRNIEIENE